MRNVTIKTIFIGLFGITFFAVLPEIILPSFTITWIALIAALITMVSGVISNYYKNRHLRLVMLLSLFLVLFTWSLRAWMYLYGLSWFLILVLFAGLVLSGLLPYINNRLSKFIYWEGLAPKTKFGKIILKLSLFLGPSIGVLGASFGLHSKKIPTENSPMLWFFAVGMYIIVSTLLLYNVYDYANNTPFHWQPWHLWKKKNIRKINSNEEN